MRARREQKSKKQKMTNRQLARKSNDMRSRSPPTPDLGTRDVELKPEERTKARERNDCRVCMAIK